MRLAIMQPYFFPYPGYFQLIQACDKFLVYDDVNFIKQGWINRNYLRGKKEPLPFTVPLRKASSFQPINQTEIHEDLYRQWKTKFQKSLAQTYQKAPHYEKFIPVVEKTIANPGKTIAELAKNSIVNTMAHLGIEKSVMPSSHALSAELTGKQRVINLCRHFNASEYVNLPGGKELYSPEEFEQNGVTLQFVESAHKSVINGYDFRFNLSIIDACMHLSPEQVRKMLSAYTLS